LEGARSVRVAEDLIQFLDNTFLDFWVGGHHGKEETASGGGCVVTLESEPRETFKSGYGLEILKERGHSTAG